MGEFNDRSFWKQRCQTEKEVTKEMFSNKVSLHSRFLFLAIPMQMDAEHIQDNSLVPDIKC